MSYKENVVKFLSPVSRNVTSFGKRVLAVVVKMRLYWNDGPQSNVTDDHVKTQRRQYDNGGGVWCVPSTNQGLPGLPSRREVDIFPQSTQKEPALLTP